jgi:AhpC/TSA antioxidant enzyme
MFCREQAVQLHRAKDAIHARGAELVLVGNGAPHFVQAFREDLGLTTPVYVDPSLASYRALGMKRGLVGTILSPRILAHAARALRGGFMQGRTRGDAWQLGGVLVVKRGGEIAYRHLSDEAGDHPPVDDVVAALG